jgi:hypothetical protein
VVKLKDKGKVALGLHTVNQVEVIRNNVVIAFAYRRRDGMFMYKDEVLSRARLIALFDEGVEA